MKLQMMRFLVFSLVFLAGCASVERPDADLCIVNAPDQVRKCYNLKRDYNSSGNIKSTAKPVYRTNASIEDLNKSLVIDSATGFPDGLARLKAYIKKLREAYEHEKQSCR